jgi:hypothetical protein
MAQDATQDVTRDGRWMTYGELARARGIDRQSAVKLVRRQHWRRQPGNNGEVRVFVPLDGMSRPATRDMALDDAGDETRDETPPMTPDTTGFEAVLAAIEAAHASEVAALRERVDAAEVSRATTQVTADRLAAQLADATARIDQADADRRVGEGRAERAEVALGAERQRADALRDRLAEAQAAADEAGGRARQAEETTKQLRQAEARRKARGRLRRAWDGWRGR